MAIFLVIDTVGGADFQANHLRNVASLHVGGGALATKTLELTGSYLQNGTIATAGTQNGHFQNVTFTPDVAATVNAFEIRPVITEAASGTHGAFRTMYIHPPTINAGAAAVTLSATVEVSGAPSNGITNYAFLVSQGAVRFAETISVGGVATFDTDIVVQTIRRATADAADNSFVSIGGGGLVNGDRGAYIFLYGNEHASLGRLVLSAGHIDTAYGELTGKGSTVYAWDGSASVPRHAWFGGARAAQQTVTGSRGGNAALASLLTALATYSLIVNSSTA